MRMYAHIFVCIYIIRSGFGFWGMHHLKLNRQQYFEHNFGNSNPIQYIVMDRLISGQVSRLPAFN